MHDMNHDSNIKLQVNIFYLCFIVILAISENCCQPLMKDDVFFNRTDTNLG